MVLKYLLHLLEEIIHIHYKKFLLSMFLFSFILFIFEKPLNIFYILLHKNKRDSETMINI